MSLNTKVSHRLNAASWWFGAPQVYAAPILFERNAYDVPVFTRVHDFMWSGVRILLPTAAF